MTERFTNVRLPRDFTYLDHPFIDHLKSEYVITPDAGVAGDANHPGGWKVCKPVGPKLTDIAYFPALEGALAFVQGVTNDNPKLRFHEASSPMWTGSW